MKITCPVNPEHKRFQLRVMVPELWTVNQAGDCMDDMEDEKGDYERQYDTCVCETCGTKAVIEDDGDREPPLAVPPEADMPGLGHEAVAR